MEIANGAVRQASKNVSRKLNRGVWFFSLSERPLRRVPVLDGPTTHSTERKMASVKRDHRVGQAHIEMQSLCHIKALGGPQRCDKRAAISTVQRLSLVEPLRREVLRSAVETVCRCRQAWRGIRCWLETGSTCRPRLPISKPTMRTRGPLS